MARTSAAKEPVKLKPLHAVLVTLALPLFLALFVVGAVGLHVLTGDLFAVHRVPARARPSHASAPPHLPYRCLLRTLSCAHNAAKQQWVNNGSLTDKSPGRR